MTGRNARLLPSATLMAMPMPALRSADALHAFGADLGDPVAAPGAHQLEVAAALARHHFGVRGHGVGKDLRARSPKTRRRVGPRAARRRAPVRSSGHRIVRRGTAVDTADEIALQAST